MVMLGEVHTALLSTSEALGNHAAAQLLALQPGSTVRSRERPIRQVVSPDLLTGFDCPAPSSTGSRSRLIGTVVTRVAVTGGQLVQAISAVRLGRGGSARRPWSHYLARPGVAEPVGRFRPHDAAAGFLKGRSDPQTLDLAAICARALSAVQLSPVIDRRPAFKAARTRLRWTADRDADQATAPTGAIDFGISADGSRTLRLALTGQPEDDDGVLELCADVALHDWLLTTLVGFIDRARIGHHPKHEVVRQLRPAVDHLIHAWMPAARAPRWLDDYWAELERQPGFSRQWQSLVGRVRDQLTLATVDALAGPRLVDLATGAEVHRDERR